MLDEAGFELALNLDDVASGQRRLDIAARHPAPDQDIARAVRVDLGSALGECGLHGQQRRPLLPGHRETGKIASFDGLPLADDGGNRFAAETCLALGKDRLIGERRDDAEDIAAGNVLGRQYTDDPCMLRNPGVEIAEAEAGMVMRRPDGPHPQGIGGNAVGAEALSPHDLRKPIEPRDPRAHGTALFRLLELCGPFRCSIGDRIDDLGIAGATAEDAAQRIGDHLARGCGFALEEVRCGNQHAGRADAALRRTTRQEGLAQQGSAAGFGIQPLNGHDLGAAELSGGHKAGAGDFAIDEDGAGAAVARVATGLGSGLAQRVAQHIRQARCR